MRSLEHALASAQQTSCPKRPVSWTGELISAISVHTRYEGETLMDPLMDFDYYLVTTDGVTELWTAVDEDVHCLLGCDTVEKIDFWQALQWDAENGGGHLPSAEGQVILQGLGELLEPAPGEGERLDAEALEDLQLALDTLGIRVSDID